MASLSRIKEGISEAVGSGTSFGSRESTKRRSKTSRFGSISFFTSLMRVGKSDTSIMVGFALIGSDIKEFRVSLVMAMRDNALRALTLKKQTYRFPTMDFYCAAEVQQLAPVLALCLGIGKAPETIRNLFQIVNLNDQVWDNFIIKNRLLTTKYNLRFEDSKTSVIERVQMHRNKNLGSHSALSPFNTSSDLFPNGIISDTWFKKYLHDIPFAIVVGYDIGLETDIDALGKTLAGDLSRCSDLAIGYVAIVVSNIANNESDLDKLGTLRRVSGLPYKSKLFHVNSCSETLKQDCSVVVSSIIKSLKSCASDFYSLIERKVYERSGKYYTMPISNTRTNIKLTPKILETRNLIKRGMLLQFVSSHNIEASLQVLEHAYENIIELLTENGSSFTQPNSPPHDKALHKAWVRLADILMIHLVRGYYSIEEPITALRKHQAHIDIGRKLHTARAPESIALWTAHQYHWLAELMALIPGSILDLKKRENQKPDSLQFFGGVKLGDKIYLTTLPYMVFARAAASMLPCPDIKLLESDLLVVTNPRDLLDYKANLLQLSYKHNQSSPSHSSSFDSYLKWQLAQIYTSLGEFTEAVDSYDGVDPAIISKPYRTYILEKLLFAAVKQPDKRTLLSEVIKHSSVEYAHVNTNLQVELPNIEDGILESFPYLVKLEASIYNTSGSDETHAFDGICYQFVLHSTFSPRLVEKVFKGATASLDLQEIKVFFAEGRQLVLGPGGDQNSTLQSARIDQDKALFNFSKFSNLGEQPLILLANENAPNTGWMVIDRVEVKVHVVVASEAHSLLVKKVERHLFDHTKIGNSLEIYNCNSSSSTIRLKGRSATSLLVKPYFPIFGCKLETDLSFILLGEKLRAPIDITSVGIPLDKLAFSDINVYVKSTIFKDSNETKDLSMQINWDGLKDDEPLELLRPIKAGKTHFLPSLLASISKSPNAMLGLHAKYKAVLEFFVVCIEFSGTLSDVPLLNVEVPVYLEVFLPRFEVFPQLNPNKPAVLSNPFVVNPEAAEFSLPLPSRTWELKMEVNARDKLMEQQKINIHKVELVLHSNSNGISADWISDAEHREGVITRSFEVNGKHAFPQSANISVYATIIYSRLGSEERLGQSLESKEFVLQLQDPRVLLQVRKVGNIYEFLYIVENPTSRILTFATSMMTDKALLHGSRWEFEDCRNEVPLSNNLVHVLPRSEVKLSFYGSVTHDQGSKVEFPVLQVFDVNYKVNLPAVLLHISL